MSTSPDKLQTHSPVARDLLLPVMEHFYTLQGEGAHTGRAAYFIRLAGCDVGCVWCDVKESWDADLHPRRSIEELKTIIEASPATMAVVTGGEPLMHDLRSLTEALQTAGIRTHLETSGSHPLSGAWDWICLSPKKFKAPLPEVMQAANELKVVVYHRSDLAWAEQQASAVRVDCQLFLQPEWSRKDLLMPELLDYIQSHPRWRLSLQIHKYIDIP